MTNHIILFNGPPGSGKDLAAYIISRKGNKDKYEIIQEKYAFAIKAAVHAMFGLNYDIDYGGDLEDDKEKILPSLGVSYRQALINLSESHMKPSYGIDVFGKLLVSRVREQTGHGAPTIVTISDAGFYDESAYAIQALADSFTFTGIRLYRDGCSFVGDSRSYVHFESLGIETKEIKNNGTVEEFEQALRAAVPFAFEEVSGDNS